MASSELKVLEQLRRREGSIVDRVLVDGRRMMRKRPVGSAMDGDVHGHYRRAVAVAGLLRSSGAVAAHRLTGDVAAGGGDDGPALLIDAGDGQLLTEVLTDGLPIEDRAALLLQTLAAVGQLHERQLVHGDLRLDGLVVGATNGVQILDLESVRPVNPEVVLDGRAAGSSSVFAASLQEDMAALGLLFESFFPDELTIADANSLGQLRDRLLGLGLPYRSTRALEHDLRFLVEAYQRTGSLDLAPELLVGFGADAPLVGRVDETEQLAERLRDATPGQVLCITGDAGVGKSSLLDWMATEARAQGRLVARTGFSRTGSRPYGEISELLDAVVADRSGAPSPDFTAWVDSMASATELASPLLSLAPSLATILGPAPAPAPDAISAEEWHVRLRRAAQVLCSSIDRTGRPPLLIIDDVQWADAESLHLVEAMIEADRAPVVVVAHRPLPERVGSPSLDRLTVDAFHLKVGPLSVGGVSEMIASLLTTTVGVVSAARRVHELTGGYPFDVLQLIQRAIDDRVLVYDVIAGGWGWRNEDLAAMAVTPNVADLIVESIASLPLEHRRILLAAACVGRPFSIAEAAAAAGESADLAAEAIWAGIEQRVIRRSSGPRHSVAYLSLDTIYEFSHDRVTDALVAGSDPVGRRACHLRLGRHYAAEQGLIPAAVHLVEGGPLVDDAAERRSLASTLGQAGDLARRSASFELGHSFFQAGLDLIADDRGPDGSMGGDRLAFDLHLGAADALFLMADFDRMQEHLAVVEAATDDRPTLIRAATYRCRAHFTRQEIQAAVEVGVQALDRLGHPLPAKASKARVARTLLGLRLTLSRFSDDDILALPPCTDPEAVELLHLLHETLTSLYGHRVDLLPLVVAKGVAVTLEHGHSEFSPVILAAFGMLHSVIGDHERAHRYGKLALTLADRDEYQGTRPRTHFLYYNFVHPWHGPLRASQEPVNRSFQDSLTRGDLDFAGILAVVEVYQMIAAGTRLSDVAGRCEEHLGRIGDNENAHSLGALVHQYVNNLMGNAPDKLVLAGNGGYDERVEGPRAEAEGDSVARSSLLLSRMGVSFWAGEHERAIACYDELEIEGMAATLNVAQSQMMDLLARCEVDPRSRATRKAARRAVRDFARWESLSPENWQAPSHLVKGCWARSRGKVTEAEVEFDRAIQAADKHGLTHLAGLAREHLGELCLETGRVSLGEYYLSEALSTYIDIDYGLRVAYLEQKYGPSRHVPSRQIESGSGPIELREAVAALTSAEDGRHLIGDVLERLRQATSADALFLMVGPDGEGSVEAALVGGQPPRFSADGWPLVGRVDAATRMVDRTGESLLIADVKATIFGAEPEVLARSVRSLLVVPVKARGRMIGQLQLEHHGRTHAFTGHDQVTTEVMVAQLALGLENLQLAGQLDELTRRQAELADASRRFVPDELLDWLGHDGLEAVQLGDSIVKEMTVMFSDIRSYTQLAEQSDPDETKRLEIDFFTTIEPPIVTNNGFIQAFRGDEVLAVFHRAPEDALNAGKAMISAQRRRRDLTGVDLNAGIGINTGLVSVGTTGGVQRLSTSLSGDAVNLASRIESVTRRYGSELLIGETTYGALQPVARADIRRVERVRVVNRSTPVTIYEVFGADPDDLLEAKRAVAPLAADAFGHYDAGELDEAVALFHRWADLVPSDPVPGLHLRRLASVDRSVPWDPVTLLSEK